MQTQDKAKGTQAMNAEQVERQHKKNCALFPKKFNAETQVDAKEVRVTKLTNVNIHIVIYLCKNDTFI